MELFLVQHGESKSEAQDPERPLTDLGAETVRRMAAWTKEVGVRVDQIRHSGKKRAAQTAELFAERLEPAQGTIAIAGINPNDDVRPVAEAMQFEEKTIMLVGHLPFLSRLTGLLVGENPERGVVRFSYAAVVCLSREENKWSVSWVMPPHLVIPATARR